MLNGVRREFKTEDGSVWLMEGDAYEILPQVEQSIDCIITDPPYEITATGGGYGATRKYLQQTTGFTDCGFDYAILDRFPNWVCFGTLRQVPKLIDCAAKRRWMLITWNKSNPCPLVNGNYLPDTEYIIHAWSKGNLYGSFADKARFIVHPLGDKEHGKHPNEKPMPVMRKLVATGSDVGQLVGDPFFGSCTTGVACLRAGRRFIGIEKEPWAFDIGVQRIQRELEKLRMFVPVPRITQRSLLED